MTTIKTIFRLTSLAAVAFVGWVLLASAIYTAPWATLTALTSLTAVWLACRDAGLDEVDG
jgi:hypothetical protein